MLNILAGIVALILFFVMLFFFKVFMKNWIALTLSLIAANLFFRLAIYIERENGWYLIALYVVVIIAVYFMMHFVTDRQMAAMLPATIVLYQDVMEACIAKGASLEIVQSELSCFHYQRMTDKKITLMEKEVSAIAFENVMVQLIAKDMIERGDFESDITPVLNKKGKDGQGLVR